MITFADCIGFARLYGNLLGSITECTITQQDKDGAANVLKEIADRQSNWTEKQKAIYKSFVEVARGNKETHR